MKRLLLIVTLLLLTGLASFAYARQAIVPGLMYSNETSTREALVPGYGYLNETVAEEAVTRRIF